MALTQISTGGVKDDAVTAGKIPANAVGSSEIADNAVTATQIADGTITSTQLAANTIGTGRIADDAVTQAKIANDAIGQDQLADNAVVLANLTNDCVTGDKIADEAIAESRLEISNAGTNGQFLQKQSGNTGGLTWADVTIPPSGNTVDLVADGAIAAGKPCIVTTAGKAQQVGLLNQAKGSTISNNIETNLTTQDEFYSMTWDSNREVVVMGYANSNGGRGVNVLEYNLTVGNTGVTNHGQTTAQTANCSDNTSLAFDPDTNQFIFCYRLQTAGFVSLGTVASNKSVTFGTASEWDGQSPDEMYVEYNTDQNKVIVIFRKSNELWARAGTVSGTGISSWGTAAWLSGSVEINADGKFDTCWDSTNNKVLVVYSQTNDSNHLKAVALSCSGTTLTWGTPVEIYDQSTQFPRISFDSDLGKAVTSYERTSNHRGVIQVVYISSGTTIASGNATYMESTLDGNSGGYYVHAEGHQNVYDPASKYFYIVGRYENDPNGSDRPFSYQVKINNSTNGFTKNSTYVRIYDGSGCQAHKWNNAMVALGSYGKVVSVVRNQPLGYKPRIYGSHTLESSTNFSSDQRNFIGFAPSAISNGATGTINLAGNIVSNQSGLTPGLLYKTNNDGTLTQAWGNGEVGLLAVASDKGQVIRSLV